MLNNLSLTVKSSLCFGLLTVIGVGFGLMSYFQADAAMKAVDEKHVIEEQVSQMQTLKLEIVDQAMALKVFLLTGDLSWYEKVGNEVQKIEAQFDALTNVDGLDRIKGDWQSWYDQFALTQMTMMRDPMQVDLARAIEATGASSEAMTAILTALADEISTATALMDELTDFQNRELAKLGNFALLSMAMLVGLTMLLAFFNHMIASRPLNRMLDVTQKLANGNLSVDIEANGRDDEIGKMYQALAVFRDNLSKTKELETKTEEERQALHARKTAEMQQLADVFDSNVGSIVSTVAIASSQLNSTAKSMSEISSEASHKATSASSASSQTSSNVQTVATATEEMTSTIGEISQQVAVATSSISEAVSKVQNTNGQMLALADTASKIGEVVEMISSIAEQTNLLALNATIESARAGEAGKGFAVVAGEVKDLAGQTAKATDQIASQISDIQHASRDASSSMNEVSEVIGNVHEIAASIAAAMEQQNAATQEIAGNIHQAAKGTQEVNDNIVAVAKVSEETGAASSQVMSAASELQSQSNQLRDEVNKFIAQVRAS